MRIKFWGVRGSIPCPGPTTVKYGGNTVCLELRFGDAGRRIIIDAGSGIRELGNRMLAQDLPKGSIETEIFLTHTHWDHIMGFPFFAPLYIPGTRLKIYGPVSFEEESLEEVVGGQLTYRYFPVRRSELASETEFIDLKEGRLDLGDGMVVTTKYLNHPVLCLGYRFEYRGKVLCTDYDTEPFQNVFCTDPQDPDYDRAMALEGEAVAREQNRRLEAFFQGADLLIHDTQYTQAEYESSRVGWGHTPLEHAISAANRNGVKQMALFHHDPMRTDGQIDEMRAIFCNGNGKGPTEVFFATEGAEFEL